MSENIWDPFGDLRRIQERISKMLGEIPGEVPIGRRAAEMPSIDVCEHGNDVVVTADMPGVDKSDIMINVRDGNVLEISAEKRTEKEEREKGFVRHERGYMGYYRTVTLPAPVDKSKARATYNNGVLEITLPMTEEARFSSIPVS